MTASQIRTGFVIAWILGLTLSAEGVRAETPQQILDGYAQTSKRAPDAERGRLFFTQSHGQEWRCATCHGDMPTKDGRHASTGKTILPLAPAANAERLTEPTKVEKWFRRNCKDVLSRECSAEEKSDVMKWLIQIQR